MMNETIAYIPGEVMLAIIIIFTLVILFLEARREYLKHRKLEQDKYDLIHED